MVAAKRLMAFQWMQAQVNRHCGLGPQFLGKHDDSSMLTDPESSSG
jgi:hypothetical protein